MKIKEDKLKTKRQKIPVDDDGSDALLGFEESTGSYIDWGDGESPQQFRWTPENTRLMLKLRFDRQPHFQQRLRQKKELWLEIATEMQSKGYFVTPDLCDLKYRNMLQTYKKNRIKEDSGLQTLIVWEYYDIFKEALKEAEEAEAQEEQERLDPSLLCESVCEDDNGNENENNSAVEHSKVIDSLKMKETQNSEPQPKKFMPSLQKKRTRSSQRFGSVVMVQLGPDFNNDNLEKSIKLEEKALSLNDCEVPVTTPAPTSVPSLNQSASIDCYLPSKRQRQCTVQSDTECDNNDLVSLSVPANKDELGRLSNLDPPPFSKCVSGVLHKNNAVIPPLPTWLTPFEFHECQVFGESIGLQLAYVKEPESRALLQLKIQELVYLTKTGKLTENISWQNSN